MRLSKVSIELDRKQVVDGTTKKLNTNFMLDATFDICKASFIIYQNFKIALKFMNTCDFVLKLILSIK